MCMGSLFEKWIVWGVKIEGLFSEIQRMETVGGGQDRGKKDRGGGYNIDVGALCFCSPKDMNVL